MFSRHEKKRVVAVANLNCPREWKQRRLLQSPFQLSEATLKASLLKKRLGQAMGVVRENSSLPAISPSVHAPEAIARRFCTNSNPHEALVALRGGFEKAPGLLTVPT